MLILFISFLLSCNTAPVIVKIQTKQTVVAKQAKANTADLFPLATILFNQQYISL